MYDDSEDEVVDVGGEVRGDIADGAWVGGEVRVDSACVGGEDVVGDGDVEAGEIHVCIF